MPNILSPLQASVVQWLVQPGQTVAAGDVLAILEAMKMEHEVRAPAAGRVNHLCFAVGELVQEKDVLLNWELLAHIPRGPEANLVSKPVPQATPADAPAPAMPRACAVRAKTLPTCVTLVPSSNTAHWPWPPSAAAAPSKT